MARNEILQSPPVTPVVQEPPSIVVSIVPLVPVERIVLSVMREFEKCNPPIFLGDPDLVETKLWLKRIVHIFYHIELVKDQLRIGAATFQFFGRAQIW